MQKKIRPGVYAIVLWNQYIVLVNKIKGPFSGLLDLPGGGIEHGEKPEETLRRELEEEIGANEVMNQKLLGVYTYVVDHIWEGIEYSEHILGIVYTCKLDEMPNKYNTVSIEGNDISGITLIGLDQYENYKLTPICKTAIEAYIKQL